MESKRTPSVFIKSIVGTMLFLKDNIYSKSEAAQRKVRIYFYEAVLILLF